VIRTQIEGFAAGAGNIAQRQQYFRSGQVFAGAPMYARTRGMLGDKSLHDGRLAGAGLGGDRNNPPPAFAGQCEGPPQPS
jgi:hypothetical protein